MKKKYLTVRPADPHCGNATGKTISLSPSSISDIFSLFEQYVYRDTRQWLLFQQSIVFLVFFFFLVENIGVSGRMVGGTHTELPDFKGIFS